MLNSTTRTLRMLALTGAAVAAIAAQPALAADATGSLSATATVTSNCAVTTTAVAFGNVNVTLNANVDGTGGISVTCTNGTAWTAKANAGSGSLATISSRKMTSGLNLLDYTLYTDSGRLTIWGDGTTGNGSTITGTGSGNAQATTIYGRIPSGQTTKPVGSYADTVTVTVSYT
ncbi:spore coat U domain-containing protein [Sphingomonas sp.]|uniref:Csu type fimbrial protein n=1 Tax=Sphingomonas sp. TaxID=28214 RepID=UPI0017ED7B46|nr:spore coat U domain-containing protein [Sphingomonas sp.]MBA3511577.1 spore coat protein U domain-containing protein [Sphingomonas sp.]